MPERKSLVSSLSKRFPFQIERIKLISYLVFDILSPTLHARIHFHLGISQNERPKGGTPLPQLQTPQPILSFNLCNYNRLGQNVPQTEYACCLGVYLIVHK